MSVEAVSKPLVDYPPVPLTGEDLEPEFRAVERHGVRRGLRLERYFWSVLKRMAESRRMTQGHLIEEISRITPENGNLTSSIRVACVRWLADQNAELKKLTSLKGANTILQACPSPAFALSSAKKILAYNPAFQLLVRRQLPVDNDTSGRLDLKLALDLSVIEIFARLNSNAEQPVTTGFVIGAADRRYRAQLNVVRAPLDEADVLLAFVFG